MTKSLVKLVVVVTVLILFGLSEIKAEAATMGYIGAASSNSSSDTTVNNKEVPSTNTKTISSPSNNQSTVVNNNLPSTDNNNQSSTNNKDLSSTNNNKDTSSSNTVVGDPNTSKSTDTKSSAPKVKANAFAAAAAVSPASSAGVSSNVQAASVQVEPSSGSAGLSIPIAVPAGRAGIQPNLSVVYNSGNRQLGNAGVGWNLDLGAIQISTKRGVPKYDGTDIFTMEQAGSTQDLVADPNVSGLYHMEVEGSFAYIQFFTDHWVITDKKGIKYYYGNTLDSKQADPANPTHIFRWALNKVEDLNGNYMAISYLNDQGQIYPQTISYTGNDASALNLSPYAQVSISYVAATSPSTAYISQFLVSTAQRIDHITVSVGPNVQSTYTFTYHQSASTLRDLLQSIQEIGSDGSSQLPAVTFTYNEAEPSWQVDSSWNLSNFPAFTTYANSNWEDLGTHVVDMNGDGYPDAVQYSSPWGGPTNNQPYLNTKQKSFVTTNSWKLSMTGIPKDPPPNPGFVAYCSINRYTGLTLLDVDGDGLPDQIQDYREDQYYGGNYYEYADINDGINGFNYDGSWTLPQDALVDYELGVPVFGYTVPGATNFGDVTGAGYPDVVIARTDWYPSHNVYINNKAINPGTKGWTLSNQWATPAGVDFNKGATLVDLNGDGLADIISIVSGVVTVYMNTGNGWVLDPNSPWIQNIPSYDDLTDGYITFADMNGDGLPDLVSWGTVYFNTGHGWNPNRVDLSASLPARDLLKFQITDLNAEGLNGFLFSYSNICEFFENQNKYPEDILVGVNNGIGASTSIQYDSSFHYQNTYLPYFIPVVKSITTTVENPLVGDETYTTQYSYSGGLWDKNYREFDGFATVTVTDPQGNYVTSSYLQDHWLKGHPLEQDTYDSKGNLYSKTVNQWQTQTIASNTTSNQISKFLYVSRTDNYLYDGNNVATPKRTAQEFTYGENPQYGDPTQTINDGQVNPTSGASIDANKTTTNISYVNNINNWLIGLPAQTITLNTTGTTISKTSFYYDNDVTGKAVPKLGRLTSKINWLGSSTQADPKTSYTYDAYGNLLTTTDPNGNTTTITYDATVHVFPVQTSNALRQTTKMSYYGVAGIALDDGKGLHGLWGQDRSKTDANNQTAYTTYDPLGRPLTQIGPLDTISLPTTQNSYQINPIANWWHFISVTTQARVNSGAAQTIESIQYYDGLGRLIENMSFGPTAGQYMVSGQTGYDGRGLPVKSYLPSFVPELTMVPFSKAGYVQKVYDAMGRLVKTINPDGTYSSIVYDHWTTTNTDENGHMQQSIVDAFGRLVQKKEYTGANGRSAQYHSSSYVLYATTNYKYDPRGNLISVTDANNNVTTITYDNLGRKIAMNDPDMGKWQYVYDGNGNLIAQEDAKGQVISFKYDALNRLINKTDAITGPIVNLPGLAVTPATFTVSYNFDDKTQKYGIGRLGSVGYDTGSAAFVYDQLGREISSTKNIANSNYTVIRKYDDLNRLQQLQYPDGSLVAYTYNQAGQLSGVADTGAGKNIYTKAISYNANGQITQIQYGNGVTTAYTYNPNNFRLTRIYTSNAQATVVQDLNYTYDSIGQVIDINDNVNTATQSFTYDALNRLITAAGSYGYNIYAYDPIGNITLKDGLNYNYGEANSRLNAAGPHAVTSLSDGTVFKYDPNGNMVSLSKGSNLTKYVYDSQNRLQSVTVGGLKIADYAYDGDGGRIKKSVYRRDLALYNANASPTLFGNQSGKPLPATAANTTTDTSIYVGNVYEEETPSNVSPTRHSRFIYMGSSRVAMEGADNKPFYYHTDHLGGTNVLTDASEEQYANYSRMILSARSPVMKSTAAILRQHGITSQVSRWMMRRG